MGVFHRGTEICVTHRLLDLHSVPASGQPGSDPTVPEIVLVEVRRQLGPGNSPFERAAQDADPLTS
jgi:hypothetical protein